MASILQDEYNLSCAGTLSIRSERSPFRLLMMDGPTCNTSLHRHLGFGNTPFKAHSYSIDSKARSLLSLRLGFQSSDQVRTFTSELLQEFDGNDNALVAKSVRKHNKADVGG
jgi:hypothetical protein